MTHYTSCSGSQIWVTVHHTHQHSPRKFPLEAVQRQTQTQWMSFLWGAFNDDPPTLFDPPVSGSPSFTFASNNKDMWSILDEMEERDWSKLLEIDIVMSSSLFVLITYYSVMTDTYERD